MVNANEPSTKFFGPNYPFVPAAVPNHWIVHLYNLKPGSTWNPAEAPELLNDMTFIPFGTPAIWLWPGIFFWGTLRFHLFKINLIVRNRFDRSYVFLFELDFTSQRWCLNELLVPAGNFACKGTATMIFRKQ